MITVTRLEWEITNTHNPLKMGTSSAVLSWYLMPSNKQSIGEVKE